MSFGFLCPTTVVPTLVEPAHEISAVTLPNWEMTHFPTVDQENPVWGVGGGEAGSSSSSWGQDMPLV